MVLYFRKGFELVFGLRVRDLSLLRWFLGKVVKMKVGFFVFGEGILF